MKRDPVLGGVWIFPSLPPLGAAALPVCVISPIAALMTWNKATCQFFGTDPEFRHLGLSPNNVFEGSVTTWAEFVDKLVIRMWKMK